MAISWEISMLNFLKNRKNHIFLGFLIIFILLGMSLYDITITNGEAYYQKSVNNRLKQIETQAKRGDILDRNGKILATSEVGFTIELNSSVIPSEQFSDVAISIYDFLEKQNEKHIEFPIFIENGEYKYRFDENIEKWLTDNGYDNTWTAQGVFEDIRSVNYIDPQMSNFEAYRLLYNQGKYLPISTARMLFLEEIYKINFLKMYGLDESISAKDAFESIRNRSEFRISSNYSDEDAYKILDRKSVV